ncbi:MAG: SGNH/GDSL hydrolase family protein [Bacteroidota bacterium]
MSNNGTNKVVDLNEVAMSENGRGIVNPADPTPSNFLHMHWVECAINGTYVNYSNLTANAGDKLRYNREVLGWQRGQGDADFSILNADLDADGHKLTNLGDAEELTDAANIKVVLDKISKGASISSLGLNGRELTNIYLNVGETNYPNGLPITYLDVLVANTDDIPIQSSYLTSKLNCSWAAGTPDECKISINSSSFPSGKFTCGFWVNKTEWESNTSLRKHLFNGVSWVNIGEFDELVVGFENDIDLGSGKSIFITVRAQAGEWVFLQFKTSDFPVSVFFFSFDDTTDAGALHLANFTFIEEVINLDPFEIYYKDADNLTVSNTKKTKTEFLANIQSEISALAIDKIAIKQLSKNFATNGNNIINSIANYGESGYNKGSAITLTTADNANTDNFPLQSGYLENKIQSSWGSGYNEYKFSISKASYFPSGNITLGFWLNKTDWESFDTSKLRIYDGATFVSFIDDNDTDSLVVGFDKTIILNGGKTARVTVLAEVEDWIYIQIQSEDLTPSSCIVLFKDTSTNSNNCEIASLTIIDDIIELDPFVIYFKYKDSLTVSNIKQTKEEFMQNVITELEPVITPMITNYTYGGKLQSFLKKARDYRQGRKYSIAPTVVLLGDSITGGSWAEDFKTWLVDSFSIPSSNIEIHWYGGAGTQYMFPFIDDILINPNPDLIMFNEYEDSGDDDDRLYMLESIIGLIRERTTADIMIGTWSMRGTTVDDYYNGMPVIDNIEFTDFHFYRDLARVYNCELIDFNQAILTYIDRGGLPTDIYSVLDSVHLSSAGYTLVFLPEIKAHFNDSTWNTSLNIPYATSNQEEMIMIADELRFERFKNPKVILGNSSNWSLTGVELSTLSTSEYMEILLKDAVGFELFYNDEVGGTMKIELNSGAGLVDPSTLLINTLPLQYASEIISITYASNWDNWRFKRPFMHCTVTANELSDGVLISGQYKIVVTDIADIVTVDIANDWVEIVGDLRSLFINGFQFKIEGSTGNDGTYAVSSSSFVSGKTRIVVVEDINDATIDGFLLRTNNYQIVTCNILNSSLSVIGIFQVGREGDLVIGNLTFPRKFNEQTNHYITDTDIDDWGTPTNSNFIIGDEYEFYIKSNWINNINSGSGNYAKVFGFERGNYTLRITRTAGTINLVGIKVLH